MAEEPKGMGEAKKAEEKKGEGARQRSERAAG